MNSMHPDTVSAMRRWRRDLHAHPELAFNEFRTADLVARELAAMGIDVHRGLGKTGVVGTLSTAPGRAIALRADMDALPVREMNTFTHCSRHAGTMHACGHDGHTAMLLGAARHLATHPNFHGTVHFVFQPAEEGEGGGRAMVEDGLFERFRCDAVYGMHNWPGLPAGTFAINHGPMMAALDTFEVTVQGRGTHAAMPERGVDPFTTVAQITMALQTIPGRTLSAMDSAVVSLTQIHGGDAWNVIPDQVVMRGTVRCFSPDIQDRVEAALQTICRSTAEAHGASAIVTYRRAYPPTINTARETDIAITAARAVAGADNVEIDCKPSMASEDFAFMLQAKPGAYIWIGADGAQASLPLHNPRYDFNDDTLGLGAAYWVRLVESVLEEGTADHG
ncbi:M20 aminoacylase family protein [Variovorax ginsengisoli]|uniref:Hippurate hydrolase n=1 Tax=Variovorax ginsengisoli TaxID=363844 RepID=A0ABT9SF46_9BURK|nr:M20 aminoacylase family protein [Variovorax ginsengisoli]MDP9902995.1 hippurate hydrolase [Variovorax ginsengisoli]